MGTLARPVALPPAEEVRGLTLAVHRKRVFMWGKRLAAFLEQIYTSSKARVLTSAAQRTRDPLLGNEHPDSRISPNKCSASEYESLLRLRNGLAILYRGKSIRTREFPRTNVQPASRERPHRVRGGWGARFPIVIRESVLPRRNLDAMAQIASPEFLRGNSRVRMLFPR